MSEELTETKLDCDEITNMISDLEEQEHTLTNPETLLLNTGINDDVLQQMSEKLKKMPRNKILQMIDSLARANQLPEHDFSTYNMNSAKTKQEKIREKINNLKQQRSKIVNQKTTELKAPSKKTTKSKPNK